MGLYRLQAVLPYTTALPEDISTNTIYVDATSDGAASACGASLAAFYRDDTTTDNSVGDYISEIVTRGTGLCYVEVWEFDPNGPDRFVTNVVFTMSGSGGFSLPYEVSLVHSFQGEAPNTARTRGRNYIGPLNINALTEAEVPTPSSGFWNTLVNAAERLLDDIEGTGSTWVVYSTAGGTATVVTNGWVDNDFDTQRRRGLKPSSRIVWPNPG